MGCKYVKEFTFGGSVGESSKFVKGYYRGGKVGADEATPSPKPARGAKAQGMPRMAKAAAPARMEAMRAPEVRRAAAKRVPVAPAEPMLAMKAGGMAKMRKC